MLRLDRSTSATRKRRSRSKTNEPPPPGSSSDSDTQVDRTEEERVPPRTRKLRKKPSNPGNYFRILYIALISKHRF